MLHEPALRRHGFRPGPRIQLADGQAWTFPSPPDRAPAAVDARPGAGPGPRDPDREAVIAAVLEAEDDAERLRAELALAILLLATNYDLTPVDYCALLEYPPGDPTLAAAQRAFHDLALDYVRSSRPMAGSRPATWGWSPVLPDKANSDALFGRVFRDWTWRGATVAASLSRFLRSMLST